MEQKELRLRRVQYLICDIMDEMNAESEKNNLEILQQVIDHLSGAIGDLVDPSSTYSIDYLERKVHTAHYLLLITSGRHTYVENNIIILFDIDNHYQYDSCVKYIYIKEMSY